MSKKMPTIKKIEARMVPPEGAVPFGQTPGGKQLYREVSRRSRAVAWYDDNTPDYHEHRKQEERLRMQEGLNQVDPGSAERFWASVESQHRRWAKNEKTGEPMYKKNKPENYDKVLVYFLEDQGNGNVNRSHYEPLTAEEEAAEQALEQVKALGGGALAEAMVKAGVSANEMIEEILNRRDDTPAPVPEVVDPAVPETPVTAITAETVAVESVVEEPEAPTEPEVTHPQHRGGANWILKDGSKFRGKKTAAVKANNAL
jgi:hypothetical protein